MTCEFIDKIEDYWNKNKYSLTGRLSILLGCLGGLGSVLVGLKMFVPASIVLGICNVGIFFAGVGLTKFSEENKNLEKDNESMKCEMRRFATFRFPDISTEPISHNSIDSSNSSVSGTNCSRHSLSTDTFVEPIDLNGQFARIGISDATSEEVIPMPFNDGNTVSVD